MPNIVADLYDTPNREYHPTQGRWISPDPAGLTAADATNPQSWNRYAYVSNNPVNATDPSGLLVGSELPSLNSPCQPQARSELDAQGIQGARDSHSFQARKEIEGVEGEVGQDLRTGVPHCWVQPEARFSRLSEGVR